MIKKYRQLKDDQGGASLVYTLVIVSILLFIGGALVTFAIVSLRLSVMQQAADKAFYLSDAAMEETLTQLESRVHEAEQYALAKVNDQSSYYGEEKWIDFLRKLEADTNNGTISKERSAELLQQATSYEFHKQYYFDLYGRPSSTSWLVNDYELLDPSDDYVSTNTILFNPVWFDESIFEPLADVSLEPSDTPGFAATGKPVMTVLSELRDNLIQLTLTSNGQYNQYRKPLRVAVSLIPPDYTQVVTGDSSTVTVHQNQATSYALAAREDIVVTGGEGVTHTIQGDVYAYGTFPEKANYRISELGGLLIGYRASSNILTGVSGSFDPSLVNTSAKLSIDGNLYTRSAVKVFGDNPNLSITESVYANAILFDKESSEGRISANGNAYLMEDLILDGTNPALTVGTDARLPDTGELWGILDHDPSGSVTSGRSDLSASIIINSKTASPRITVDNAYIAGLAYFNVFRSISGVKSYYQTGESFTTNNNFYFYNTPLPGYTASFQTKFFTYTDENGVEHSMIEAIDSATDAIVQSPKFKAKYFFDSGNYNTGSISDRDRDILTIRSISIDGEGDPLGLEENYGLGVFIANKKVLDAYPDIGLAPGETLKSEFMNTSAFTARRTQVLKDMDLKMNVLATRDYQSSRNADPSDTVSTGSKMDQLIDFSQGNMTRILNPNEVIVVNGDPDRDVYINVPDSVVSSLPAAEQNGIFIRENNDVFKNINGIIMTKGNVFVYNSGSTPLTFSGSIISGKSIFLMGDGQKNFRHNQQWLNLMAAKHSQLFAMLHSDTGKMLATLDGTTSDNGSLSNVVVPNPSAVVININQQPIGSGLIKSPTEHSFTINSWSIE